MNFSVVHNYSYEGKSLLSSSLDFLSTPCKQLLGGRNVDVVAQKYDASSSSTVWKIAILACFYLFPSIALVSGASFALKLATFPHIWEQKKVNAQSSAIWEGIGKFNTAFQERKYSEAVNIFKEQPKIRIRDEININFFKAVNQKINQGSPWQDIQSDLSYLPSDQAITLMVHAIEMKLSEEFKNECSLTSATDILEFIRNSLQNRTLENITPCFEALFEGILRIDVTEKHFVSAVKIEIVNQMLADFVKLSVSCGFHNAEAEINANSLKFKALPIEGRASSYYSLMIVEENVQQLRRAVNDIRSIEQREKLFFNKLDTLSTPSNGNQEDKWKEIRSECLKFNEILDQLGAPRGEAEKEYVKFLKQNVTDRIEIIDSFWTAHSVEEFNALRTAMDTSSSQEQEVHSNFFKNVQASTCRTPLESFLLTLHLKKLGALAIFSGKINAFLTKRVVQMCSNTSQAAL